MWAIRPSTHHTTPLIVPLSPPQETITPLSSRTELHKHSRGNNAQRNARKCRNVFFTHEVMSSEIDLVLLLSLSWWCVSSWKTNYQELPKVKGFRMCVSCYGAVIVTVCECHLRSNHDSKKNTQTATHKVQVWAEMSHRKNGRRAVYISPHWSLKLHNAESRSVVL